MWYPYDKTVGTITRLRKCELFFCLNFLQDEELWLARTTCVWFREAFYALTKYGKIRVLKIAAGNRNCKFPSLKELQFDGTKWMEKVSRLNFKYQFPRLVQYCPCGVNSNLALFPKSDTVIQMVCANCKLWENLSDREHKRSMEYIFPNVQKILFANVTLRTTLFVLPQLKKLELLQGSVITGVPSLPDLKELTVIESPPHKKIIEASTALETLWLQDTFGDFTIPQKPSLTHLHIKKDCIPEWLLPKLYSLFPNLMRLSLAIRAMSEINLWTLSPHHNLEMFELVGEFEDQDGIYGLEKLSPYNFPSLSKIYTSASDFDLTVLPPNINLEKLVLGTFANISFYKPLKTDFPNLKIIREEDIFSPGLYNW